MRTRLRLALSCAAMIVVAPASAQQGDGGAVTLPPLIYDLFPSGVPNQPGGGRTVSPPLVQSAPTTPAPAGQPTTPPGGLPPSFAPPLAISGAFAPNEVLVTVEGDAAADVAAAFGLQVLSERQSALLGASLVRFGIPDGRPVGAVLAQLAGDARVTRRAPNSIYQLQQGAGGAGYAFGAIGLDPDEANGEAVNIAVIDTGIDPDNPALAGVIAATYDAMPDVAITARDHATSVAGLIAGVGPNRGMAPGARIFHARAFEGTGSTMDVILTALDWAASQDVRIVNMSFVGPDNDLLREACAAAQAQGLALVAAVGNNGPEAAFGYPAAYEDVVAVTAVDDRNGLLEQGNRGSYVFVAAPGVGLVAPIEGGADLVTGTSFAAAVVSGAIANLFHRNPGLEASDAARALAETARDLGPEGRDTDFGYGLIDAKAAISFR